MPSFTSVATLAFGLVSLSAPAFAFGSSSDAHLAARANSDIFARHDLTKRRVNHAYAYGYPFGVGPHKGHGKITPGGYKDPHAPNEGADCTVDKECHSDVALGAAMCDSGICSFRCLGDTVKNGEYCIGVYNAPSCKYDHNCPKLTGDLKRTATPVCIDSLCTFSCDDGLYAKGNSCVASATSCDGNTCPDVENGSNMCVDGACSPQCESYLGFQLYSDDTSYRCIDTQNDPESCGGVGPEYVCPTGYNGYGAPTCSKGVCGLDCHGYYYGGETNGAPYCVTA